MKKTALLVAVASLGLVACSNASQQNAPEPHPSDIKNGTNTQVIQMPEGFRNVAITCYGGNGIYVTSRGAVNVGGSSNGTGTNSLPSSIAVIVGDPMCRR